MSAVKEENISDRKTTLQQTLLNMLQSSKIPDKKQKVINPLTDDKFRLVQIETNCRRHSKVYLK